jgi:hypothetical protein
MGVLFEIARKKDKECSGGETAVTATVFSYFPISVLPRGVF